MKLLTKNTSNLAKTLLYNDILTVFPHSYSNEGTVIKAAVEYDSVSKRNLTASLTSPVDSSFTKKNSAPDPQMPYDKIVTVTAVGSTRTIDNEMFLSVTVFYFLKPGKTGDTLTELFKQHLRISQTC